MEFVSYSIPKLLEARPTQEGQDEGEGPPPLHQLQLTPNSITAYTPHRTKTSDFRLGGILQGSAPPMIKILAYQDSVIDSKKAAGVNMERTFDPG